jgi:uncharacterized spore protein YtfJ
MGVYSKFACGEHVEVGVDGDMVEDDEGVSLTIVKFGEGCGSGGGRTSGVVELEARSPLDVM